MILQKDRQGEIIAEFNSIEEASDVTGILPRTIKRTLNGELKTGGGFIWDDSDNGSIEDNTTVTIDIELYNELISSYRKVKINPKKTSSTIKYELPKPFEGNKDNVLVIGDIHAPFTREGYLEHCRKVQEQFNCGSVVFIGDIIDNHYSSYHDTDPDGLSAKDELDLTIKEVQKWYQVFPEAKVCIGNHDAIITRKAFSSGVSNRWIKSYSEVLGTPNWEFDMEHELYDVIYYHGTGSSGDKAALNRAMNLRQSVVQGHIHTVANIQYNASRKDLIFGMQVGCGVDDTSYALAYASSNIKKSIISCGVVLNKGVLPIIVPMKLS